MKCKSSSAQTPSPLGATLHQGTSPDGLLTVLAGARSTAFYLSLCGVLNYDLILLSLKVQYVF